MTTHVIGEKEYEKKLGIHHTDIQFRQIPNWKSRFFFSVTLGAFHALPWKLINNIQAYYNINNDGTLLGKISDHNHADFMRKGRYGDKVFGPGNNFAEFGITAIKGSVPEWATNEIFFFHFSN